MEEKENIVKTDNQSNKENKQIVFTREVKPIPAVKFFFLSIGNAILKGILWVVDFILSMFVSIGTFLWDAIRGAGKLCVKFVDFFKRKAHQFKYNDIYGRLSFGIFGVASFKHGQIVNGIMYVLFEIGYIILFSLWGVGAIAGIGPLGPVIKNETHWEDPWLGPQTDVTYENNSILALIFGIVAILSIFIFLYIWNRSINSGYALYRIEKYPTFDRITKETKEYSEQLSQGCFDAFQQGIKKSTFKASKKDEINAYLQRIENKQEKDYVKYLLLHTIDEAYSYLKEHKHLAIKQERATAKQAAAIEKMEAKRLVLDQKLVEASDDKTKEQANIACDKHENKTLEVKTKWQRKIDKFTNLLREVDKRYSSFAEKQNTLNNDKYGKFNFYYKNITNLNQEINFWSHYQEFVDIYNNNLGGSDNKNIENAETSKRILIECEEKVVNINAKYDEIAAKRSNTETQIKELKVQYNNDVKKLKEENPADLQQKLLELKSNLIDNATRLNHVLHDLPSVKSVAAMRKEEIKETKAACVRDRRYLKTNFTPTKYAIQCVLDEMLVKYKLDYKVAEFFAALMFKDRKQNTFYTADEVNEKIIALKDEKEQFINDNPTKYVGKPKEFKAQLNGLLNENFHITILALPILGIVFITIIPLIFSILVAFTDFSNKAGTLPPEQIHWVGLQNFFAIFDKSNLMFGSLPGELAQTLGWTFIWAICATFSNYFLGIIVALMINKDGIKFKKFWRTIFVLTIAIPQFISLLSISKLLAEQGALSLLFKDLFGFKLGFGAENNVIGTKIIIILVNIWVGIPYTILSTTGILLNIPKDLYESSRVDGAGPVTQFVKITMPYILFVTGPYLITQFIGNFNNFNVIFFLTQGGPVITDSILGVGQTDLLITFLYDLITSKQEFGIASTLGIFIFVVCAFFSIVMYNKSGSIKEEDQFQ